MRAIFALVLLMVFGFGIVAAYGYYDAYKTESGNVHINAVVRNWQFVNFDSTTHEPLIVDHGAAYIVLEYYPEQYDKIVSSITLTGSAWEGTTKLEDFSKACQQGKSEFLVTDAKYRIGIALNCFIKLKTSLPYQHDGKGITDSPTLGAVKTRVEGITLKNLTYTATVRNLPMNYITWTNDTASGVFNWVTAFVSKPFQRS